MLAQPVAFALDVDGDGSVEQSVEDGRGHDLIREDLSPCTPALVGGDDDGLLSLVSLGDDLEEEGSFGPLQRRVADLVDDQDPWSEHGGQESVLSSSAASSPEADDQVMAG